MRRAVVAGAIVVLLTGCSSTERPEGIVERWLLALNQGSAGEPQRYAAPELSASILPRFREADPGELDVVEVGRAFVGFCGQALPPDETCPAGTASASVPFRVVRVDGRAFDLDAHLLDRGDGWRIATLQDVPRNVPSQGGPPIRGAPPTDWLVAVGTGIALIVVSEGAMRLARKPGD